MPLPWYLALAGVAYGWWGWSLARSGAGSRPALFSLVLLSAVWAGLLNGGSLIFTSATIVIADVIHLGCLLFGLVAAYTTRHLLRSNRAVQVPAPEAGG